MYTLVHWDIVFVSFCVGLLLIFLMPPKQEVVYVAPTRENAGEILRDERNQCYAYHVRKQQCMEEKEISA